MAFPCDASMSFDQALWSLTASTLIPMILQSRWSNSFLRPATAPSSVVQTGVKSFGCENRIAHPSPIHSWKLMVPSVVSAVKSGASLLIRSVSAYPPPGVFSNLYVRSSSSFYRSPANVNRLTLSRLRSSTEAVDGGRSRGACHVASVVLPQRLQALLRPAALLRVHSEP